MPRPSSAKKQVVIAADEPAAPPPPEIVEEVPEEDLPDEEFPGEPEDHVIDVDVDDEDEEYYDLAQLAQLLVTEDGEPIADVLSGVRDALDKHNKILFKLVTVAKEVKDILIGGGEDEDE